jgi:TolB protein
LAVTRFPPGGTARPEIAIEVARCSTDLDLSGIFRLIDPAAFLSDARQPGLNSTQVDFGQWRLLGAEAVIKGAYTVKGDQLTLEARLDTTGRRLLTGRRYSAKWPMHGAYHTRRPDSQELTGEAGSFDARIAYISKATGHKELWLMDVDGHAPLRLTDHRSIVLNPDFSPGGKELLFTSYRAGNPTSTVKRSIPARRRASPTARD